MPEAVTDRRDRLPMLGMRDIAVGIDVRDVGHLVGAEPVLDMVHELLLERLVDLAKCMSERDQLFLGQHLAGKDEHAIAVARLDDGLLVIGAHRLAQVDIGRAGDELRVHRLECYAHDPLPLRQILRLRLSCKADPA